MHGVAPASNMTESSPESSVPAWATPWRGASRTQQIVLAVAVLVLVGVSWFAFDWFARDVEQRRAIAEGRAPDPAAPAADVDPHAPAPEDSVAAVTSTDPIAPAVRGEAIRRCVRGDQVLFTNQACPEGFSADTGPTAGPAAGDASRAAGAATPPVLAGASDPAQRGALCDYLVAEVERLDFEFQQPLPPPILDQISTRLLTLRSQGERLACSLPRAKEPSAAVRARQEARVLDETAAPAPAAAGRNRRRN